MTNFTRAFPEASIDFKVDRKASRAVAEKLLRDERLDFAGMRNTAMFDADEPAKIFLERQLGLDRAQVVMKRDVRLWFWHQRWFRPLQEEELSVDVAPTGEVIGFAHKIPEDRAAPEIDLAQARLIAVAFLRRVGVDTATLPQVDQSERRLPHRVQRIFTWESNTVRPAGAPYRYRVAVDGNVVTDYAQRLRVPDDWQRTYHELRSKNLLAGQADIIFLLITMIAALGVFITRMRRHDVNLRFLLGIAIASIVLVGGVALNSFPSALAGYDTTTSYPAFLAQFAIASVLQCIGTAMLLMVLCGSGEVLYRERLPQHLAIPRLWTARALGSKRVFRSFVLAYTMVGFFLAYQVVFYLVASKLGAWAPAEIPYDEMLNSAFPWIAVLFAGFFPALSEEFMSRAFSIPFFERIFRSRIAAIVVAGFIWGFGHATYPNQPFYIRGVEVGCAGVALGFIFFRFGLLPLLIWHYTVDAVYTALLLFRSNNTYYIVSAAAASFVFAVPMLVSIALYLKRGGFTPDDDLSNATLPLSPAPPPRRSGTMAELPPAIALRPIALAICVASVAIAAVLLAWRPPSPSDAVDYRIAKQEAKAIASKHLARVAPHASYVRTIAAPVEGFRSWDRSSSREDGGSPGQFDSIAADHLLASGLSMRGLAGVFRTRVEAATWTVRFFTPMRKEEYFVEVDPRTSRAIGFHKYQEEKNPGPRLEQAQAQAIAMTAFPLHGVDPGAFELKEALAFQQPNRRDWLFHFQERKPLADQTFGRTTVRVAGAEVTQFATTVKVPDAVVRDATTQTLRNVVLLVLRIAGGVALLAIIVTGFVSAAIRRRPRWTVALRWTLILAVIPIVGVASQYESSLFGYNTSVRWDTFFAGLAIDVLRDIGVRIGILFLAIAAIDAVVPFGLGVVSAEGRRRFGRSAVTGAVTAVAIFAIARAAFDWIAATFPAAANVSLDVPDVVAIPIPALVVILNAIFDAVAAVGVAAAFVSGIRAIGRKPWVADAVAIATIFCAAVDSGATSAQMPLMLLRSAVLAILTWAVACQLLGRNALAWPVAVFTGMMLSGIGALAGNDRADLRVNAIIVAVALVAALAWLVVPRTELPDA